MVYLVVLSVLCFFSFVEKKRDASFLFTISFVFILAFASFRFGLGEDYFNYYDYYAWNYFSSISHFASGIKNYFVEPMYAFTEFVFLSQRFPFEYFVAFVSFIILFFSFLGMYRLSKNLTLSVFVFFANYYLSAVCNMLRQGIAMSIFLFALSMLLLDRKKILYFLLVLIAYGFHKSAFICFFIPFILLIPRRFFYSPLALFLITLICLIGGIYIPNLLFDVGVKLFPSRVEAYRPSDYKVFSALLRLLELVLAFILRDKAASDKNNDKLYRLFVFGICLSLFFMTFGAATRITEYFLLIEVVLFPNLVSGCSRMNRRNWKLLLCLLYSFLFIKDLRTVPLQCNFVDHKNFWEYPYITIFDKKRIVDYRGSRAQDYFSWNGIPQRWNLPPYMIEQH